MTSPIDRAQALFDEGVECARRQDYAAAARSFGRAAEAFPGYGPSHNNLGSALAALGRHDEAIEAFRHALRVAPDYAQAHFHLGVSLQALGKRRESIACFERAVAIDPRHDEAHYYLGLAHQRNARPREALACLMRAVELNPSDSEACTALGTVLKQLRADNAAIRAFERALSIDPGNAIARAHLIDQLARDCAWDALESHRESIATLGVAGAPAPPFTLLALEDHPRRHRARSERFADANFEMITPLPVPARPATRPERLHIGYFSADFREHATMHLAAQMFELHDRDRFAITAYSYGRDEPGQMLQRALDAFDQFRDVRDLGDAEVAALARQDGIDIAVDLKGYTEHQRIAILAYRPAPIQLTFLGYPGTLGTDFIDYLVADPIVVPPEQRGAYREKLILLPDSYQVNDDSRPVPGGAVTRAEAGLPESGFVFCCFNASYKITPAEFDIWMRLMEAVEGSILWLLAGNGEAETNLRAQAAKRGIAPDRLVFAPRVHAVAHLARQPLADLFLDTFNCNAHTTASDALWAGVPLVTKTGNGFAARVAASLLEALDLSDLITTSEREYADLALRLATDPARLAAVRARVALNRASAALFDSATFTRQLERSFELVYDRYFSGLEPADINVPR
jgi:protein O-GlcNAc transferase